MAARRAHEHTHTHTRARSAHYIRVCVCAVLCICGAYIHFIYVADRGRLLNFAATRRRICEQAYTHTHIYARRFVQHFSCAGVYMYVCVCACVRVSNVEHDATAAESLNCYRSIQHTVQNNICAFCVCMCV